MKRISLLSTLAAFTLCLAFPPANVRAASTLPADPAGERFLFVVDKSADMEKLQDATEATLFDLVGSGLHGQMRAGDTFGLWTFNKEVSTGKFSMQVWDPRRARQQATVMAAFLSGVNYEGSSSTKDVTEKLKSIVHAVSNVTVFIISDGDAALKGTPFDKTINAEYKRQRKQRSSARRPFVTTLIARDGWIIDQSVTIAGTKIDLPPRPSPPQPETPALVNETKTNATVSSPVVQAPTPPAPKPAPRMTIITRPPAETNTPAQTLSAPGTPIIAATPTTETAAPPVRPPSPSPAPAPITEQGDLEVTSQASILANAGPITSHRAPTEIPSSPTPAPSGTLAPAAAASATAPRPPEPAAATTPSSAAAIETILARLAPEPTPVTARETGSATTASTTSPVAGTLQGVGTPVVMVIPGNPMLLIAFGSLMLVAALALGLAVLRHRRPPAGASLITQSMERR